mmetsp:Transcript_5996/g.16739  ORF Transcript_5996/g.16739 Transcript_5996/m.16739 type:complete len:99 (+) Transcript_5996:939-1235(+)
MDYPTGHCDYFHVIQCLNVPGYKLHGEGGMAGENGKGRGREGRRGLFCKRVPNWITYTDACGQLKSATPSVASTSLEREGPGTSEEGGSPGWAGGWPS